MNHRTVKYVDYVLLQTPPTLLTEIIHLHHLMLCFLLIMLDYAQLLVDVHDGQYYARIMCTFLSVAFT